MRVLILGCGGFHPSETRHTACVLLPELGLMLDAGTAAFRVHDHIATDRLDVVLSHAHLDHVVGLTYLLGLQHRGRDVTVTVHAARTTLDAVRNALLDPRLFPITPVAGFAELGDPVALPAGAEVRTFPLHHPGGSVGMRIENGGKALAYTTDTTALEASTIDVIRGVDVLIHEAYFTESERDLAAKTGHSTASDAARAAAAADVGRLVLVHRDPRAADDDQALAEARRIFSKTECARDGMELEL